MNNQNFDNQRLLDILSKDYAKEHILKTIMDWDVRNFYEDGWTKKRTSIRKTILDRIVPINLKNLNDNSNEISKKLTNIIEHVLYNSTQRITIKIYMSCGENIETLVWDVIVNFKGQNFNLLSKAKHYDNKHPFKDWKFKYNNEELNKLVTAFYKFNDIDVDSLSNNPIYIEEFENSKKFTSMFINDTIYRHFFKEHQKQVLEQINQGLLDEDKLTLDNVSSKYFTNWLDSTRKC